MFTKDYKKSKIIKRIKMTGSQFKQQMKQEKFYAYSFVLILRKLVWWQAHLIGLKWSTLDNVGSLTLTPFGSVLAELRTSLGSFTTCCCGFQRQKKGNTHKINNRKIELIYSSSHIRMFAWYVGEDSQFVCLYKFLQQIYFKGSFFFLFPIWICF